MINITVLRDQNMKVKKLEKITKYEDLRLQVQKLWAVRTIVIPIVVGALGTVSEELENQLKTIGIPIIISCLHKVALVGTAFILRRVLVISEVVNSQMVRHFSHHVVMTSSKKNQEKQCKVQKCHKTSLLNGVSIMPLSALLLDHINIAPD